MKLLAENSNVSFTPTGVLKVRTDPIDDNQVFMALDEILGKLC